MSRNVLNSTRCTTAIVSITCVMLANSGVFAQTLGYASPAVQHGSVFEQVVKEPADIGRSAAELAPHLRRQLVVYPTSEGSGTVIIDTPNTRLYYVLGGGRAISYGIGVGRDGFTWSGVKSIARKAEWPDWIPPAEMLQRQPYLPRFMAGGPGNPLGARALYLGGSTYRIHGTNAPDTIGGHVSSGCIRMLNKDVIDLYGRVGIGTKVVVLPDRGRAASLARIEPPSSTRPVITRRNQVRPFGIY